MNRPALNPKDLNQVLLEFAELKARLEDAEQTIDAIRSGEVDALVVRGQNGDQVFTLKGADEPYRIFVERMQDGAATLDHEGTIMYCNRAFATLIGEPLERVIGTNLNAHLPNPSISGVGDIALTQAGRAEINLTTEVRNVPVICSVTPVELDSPAAFAVTLTDLTQLKQHEMALRKATAELEGFCYSVSHDMRAPLRNMISSASIVIEDYGELLPEEAKRDLSRIVHSADYLGRLMDDLLSYSRLSSHEIRREPVDLSAMAEQMIEGIEGITKAEIEWNIEPEMVVQADPRFADMVLHNLLSNAAKFSSKSTPPIIEFGHDKARKAYFVRDNGIGFDMHYVSKLFEPFERLHGPNEYPGTGIGLANVKRIVNLHAGKVSAESTPGHGATFYFTLDKD